MIFQRNNKSVALPGIATGILLFLTINVAMGVDMPLRAFHLDPYIQDVNAWIDPAAPDYHRLIWPIAYQQAKTEELKQQLLNPWQWDYVQGFLRAEEGPQRRNDWSIRTYLIAGDGTYRDAWGANYRKHSRAWKDQLAGNVNLTQFSTASFAMSRRAIAVDNLPGRALPTRDPHYHDFSLPGEGYPFDNLQMTSIWAGTPLYIAGESLDGVWYYVLSSSVAAWVPASGVAHASEDFVVRWTRATNEGLTAVTRSDTAINDARQLLLHGYLGAVFPSVRRSDRDVNRVLVPQKNADGLAVAMDASIASNRSASVPIAATPANFAELLSGQLGRVYAWGGKNFYNDCSLELKNLYAAFGIWLERNTYYQSLQGTPTDLSALWHEDSNRVQRRIDYVKANAEPFKTLIYIPGHIMLYTGLEHVDGLQEAGIYNTIWGLAPPNREERVIIGQASFLPLLGSYPGQEELESLADKSGFVLVAFGEELIETNITAEGGSALQSNRHLFRDKRWYQRPTSSHPLPPPRP
ncbi:MAG: SH3 domain-containing protein [Pseudomonadota bacterium]